MSVRDRLMKFLRIRIKLSGWHVLWAMVLLFVVTVFLFHCYGILHWGIMLDGTYMRGNLEELLENESTAMIIETNEELQKFFDRLTRSLDRLDKSRGKLWSLFTLYDLTGSICFLVSILSVLGRPRKLAFICIPLGLIAWWISMTIM